MCICSPHCTSMYNLTLIKLIIPWLSREILTHSLFAKTSLLLTREKFLIFILYRTRHPHLPLTYRSNEVFSDVLIEAPSVVIKLSSVCRSHGGDGGMVTCIMTLLRFLNTIS